MAESTLIKKMLVKPGYRMLIFNDPAAYREQFEPLPEGASIETDLQGTFDWILAFFHSKADVDRDAPRLIQAAKAGALVWFAYPKKSGKSKPDINRDTGWETVRGSGWEAVAVVAIDTTWAAMRYRPSSDVKSRR